MAAKRNKHAGWYKNKESRWFMDGERKKEEELEVRETIGFDTILNNENSVKYNILLMKYIYI